LVKMSSSKSKKLNCQKGKSCGSTCINKSKVCKVDLEGSTTKAITKVKTVLVSNPSGGTVWARGDASDFDNDLKTRAITKRDGDPNYDWETSKGSGSKVIGEGEFGSVIKEGGTGQVVKRGNIGENEFEIAKKLGDRDLGPKPLALELDGQGNEVGFKKGRMAMSLIPGEPIGSSRQPDDEIGGVKVADVFWRARAELHRMGIAHNDMHTDNLLIDSNGKGRFVDLGLSQGFSKAALAEAMGLFADPIVEATGSRHKISGADGGGDWQVLRWEGNGGKLFRDAWGPYAAKSDKEELERRAPLLARVAKNYEKVVREMKNDGFSSADVKTVIVHGIRSPEITYQQGAWAMMSNAQAKRYIELLYEGI
jgi:hypothetical protein